MWRGAELRANVREVAASLLHFVRLAAAEDLDDLRAEMHAIHRLTREAGRSLERLERATSRRPSRGPGTS